MSRITKSGPLEPAVESTKSSLDHRGSSWPCCLTSSVCLVSSWLGSKWQKSRSTSRRKNIYGLIAGPASYYANWSSWRPHCGKFNIIKLIIQNKTNPGEFFLQMLLMCWIIKLERFIIYLFIGNHHFTRVTTYTSAHTRG